MSGVTAVSAKAIGKPDAAINAPRMGVLAEVARYWAVF